MCRFPANPKRAAFLQTTSTLGRRIEIEAAHFRDLRILETTEFLGSGLCAAGWYCDDRHPAESVRRVLKLPPPGMGSGTDVANRISLHRASLIWFFPVSSLLEYPKIHRQREVRLQPKVDEPVLAGGYLLEPMHVLTFTSHALCPVST